jgi:putative transposase
MARVAAAGVPYHITQRGNHRQQVFFLDPDYRRFLELLREWSGREGLRMLGYCLMPNHVHVVAVPDRPDSLAKSLGPAQSRYARYCNQQRGVTGHVWQDRYYSAPLDQRHLVVALRYVDCNPVRAGLAANAENYEWSSARAHVARRDPTGILDMDLWREVCSGDEWREILQAPAERSAEGRLRNATRTGKPCGNAEFVKQLQRSTGRPLQPPSASKPRI